ncbi:hypothetical protein QF032_000857 [Streptomyces achromogenes]|uniref:Uncharacterized protein n=1 Tax=Streptomyces achromogenes TaxID=67255 RepID=A0ABU0PTZ9_STRAH|nr:hypothetical protein [Streptomyces achromogenes]MDQ0829013.1 hypothetical protein [Streptomyces achromogenes]
MTATAHEIMAKFRSGLAPTAHTWSSVRSAGQRRSLRMMAVAALMSVGCPVRSSR